MSYKKFEVTPEELTGREIPGAYLPGSTFPLSGISKRGNIGMPIAKSDEESTAQIDYMTEVAQEINLRLGGLLRRAHEESEGGYSKFRIGYSFVMKYLLGFPAGGFAVYATKDKYGDFDGVMVVAGGEGALSEDSNVMVLALYAEKKENHDELAKIAESIAIDTKKVMRRDKIEVILPSKRVQPDLIQAIVVEV